MNIEDLLIDFDEMGFAPTTMCENPDEYAREWKKQLVVEIEKLKEENDYLKRTDEERYEEAEANIRAGIANGGTSCHWCEDTIRKNAIKEFAEKLKMAFYYEFDEMIPSIMSDKIDKLLKEYEK